MTLVDLDLVEPVYTLRPLKAMLTDMGDQRDCLDYRRNPGVGEAGSVLHPAMRWALRNKGDVIFRHRLWRQRQQYFKPAGRC